MNAENIIGNEQFIYTSGDDSLKATPGRFKQMVDEYEKSNASILSCIRVDRTRIRQIWNRWRD